MKCDGLGAVGVNCPVPASLGVCLPPCECPGPFDQPLPETAADLCDEVAALTDAAASAATSSAAKKAAAVANLRRFTDSSPLDSNFFSPPPQTALQQTSLPSRPSPPFRTSSFSSIQIYAAGIPSGASTSL